MEIDTFITASGKEALGGDVYVGLTIEFIEWRLQFEARDGPTWVLCKVTGGNLVAVDDVGDYMDPIAPSAYITVMITASSSATLQELQDIQHSSFEGGTWLDVVNGVSGTSYPIGTRRQPVDNLDDAHTIGHIRGFDIVYIIGNITFSATDDLDDHVIIGENIIQTTVTVSPGCSTEGTEFKDCTLAGTLSGEVEIVDSYLGTLAGFMGNAMNCGMAGHIALAAGSSSDLAQFINCYQATAAIGTIQIDMAGDGPCLALRAYSGSIEIRNKTGISKVALDFLSGRVVLHSSITAGTFFIRGVAEISSNNATGITLYSNPLTNPADIASAVWTEAITDHLSAGSFGEVLNELNAIQTGRWKIDTGTNKMTLYELDDSTPLVVFDLKDAAGQPTSTGVFERVPE